MSDLVQIDRWTRLYRARLLIQGFIGGVVGGMLGGAIWTGIAITARFPTTLFSVLAGILATAGVLLASRMQRTLPYQILSIGTTIIGLLFGKYVLFYHIFSQDIIRTHGWSAWQESGGWLFSLEVIRRFPFYIIEDFADVDMFFTGVVLGAAILVMFKLREQDNTPPQLETTG